MLAAIEATTSVRPDEYTFDTASAALSTKIKSRTVGHSISAVGSEDKPDRSVILNPDGSINAAYRADFHSLHPQLKKEIINERKKLRIGGGGQGKSKGKCKGKWNGKRNTSSFSSKVSNQSTEIKRLNAKIASLSAEGGDGDADSPDDAGNNFGGRAEMAESKKKKRKTN